MQETYMKDSHLEKIKKEFPLEKKKVYGQ